MSTTPLMHLGWQRLRAAFRGAGLPTDGFSEAGAALRVAPTPDSVVALFVSEAKREGLRQLRCFEYREGDTAGRLVLRFGAQLPELFGLHLDVAGCRLVAADLVADLEPGPSQGVDDLVRGLNRLLELAGLSTRLLPLDSDTGAAYLACSPPQAVALAKADIFGEELPELFELAGWAREASAEDAGSEVA